jgi:hypothetical protein
MYLTLLSVLPDPAHQQTGAGLAGLSGKNELFVVGVCLFSAVFKWSLNHYMHFVASQPTSKPGRPQRRLVGRIITQDFGLESFIFEGRYDILPRLAIAAAS